MSNRKVANATKLMYDGIQFDSKFELDVYRHLVNDWHVDVKYQPVTYKVTPSFIPSIPLLIRNRFKRLNKNFRKIGKSTVVDGRKVGGVEYTPDFEFDYKEKHIIIEVKGFPTGEFKYRFKMFRLYMENLPDSDRYEIWEIFTITQLKDCMENLTND